MKEKVVITTILLAMTFITAKTGYAYYENTIRYENKDASESQIIVANNDDAIQRNLEFQSLELQSEIPNQNENFSDNNTISTDSTQGIGIFNGCGGSGGYGSMLDENGNFKDRNQYENELNEKVENGEINESEKDYYLSLYDRCFNTLNGSGANDSNDLNNSAYDSSEDYNDSSDEYSDENSDYFGNNGFYPPSCH